MVFEYKYRRQALDNLSKAIEQEEKQVTKKNKGNKKALTLSNVIASIVPFFTPTS
ncbi:hypothetical protein [Metabacillus arenae]|uniref:Uncharacterized protein n=1 Tax=Metabacillus arenae TaxID=2771434 RepID=A0A926NDI9_9BACI|nr:hypothetical protein [Metabacillus arenae]MBD1379256.1 hypothetical protein [Metabacillus arenae]